MSFSQWLVGLVNALRDKVLIGHRLSKTLLFTKSTKFNDLPDNIKKVFEDIE